VQETRGWDENTGRTFSQRRKETSDDYRYFPEPDLPKLMLHELFDLDALKDGLPELPWEKKGRLMRETGISEDAAMLFVGNLELAQFFDDVIRGADASFTKLAANYITSDLVALTKDGAAIPTAQAFKQLIAMLVENTVSSRGAKDILAIMVTEGGDPVEIAEKRGLKQESNTDAIAAIIDQVITEHPTVVEEYRGGKEASLQFLIGQGMKLSKGAANPQMLKELFVSKLS
jgi:aspartyl-tRNA(Asn)/glutamyl-tRNA(Gln) amidotransferase subunit B